MDNPYNAYAIELYVGEKRSGKTLSMIADTYEDTKSNPDVIVYANFHLNKKYFPTFKYITIEELENIYTNQDEFKDAIFLIDETHTWLDSRQFAKKGNQKIGYLLGQLGKRGNVFRGTTHFPHLVDFRLRCYCEKWNYVKKGLLINNRFNQIQNYNVKLSKSEEEILTIKITPVIRKLINYDFIDMQENDYYVMANKYFDFYDTEELIIVHRDTTKK